MKKYKSCKPNMHLWEELKGSWALMEVDKIQGATFFSKNYGLPATVFVCTKCHKFELFSAIKLEKM